MHSSYYHLPEIFEKEKAYILKNSWLLMAHTSELENNFDFVTLDFLGEKIFIQNFNGNIKAFQNICLHRFNAIHTAKSGNRPPVCGYHSWSYNADGQASGIPKRATFEENEVQNLCLKEYEVAFCGAFIFVKPNRDYTVTLTDYLGPFFSELEVLSVNYGKKINDVMMPWQCNWKLVVENVVECYHCSSVHKNSFFKMGYGFHPATGIKSFGGSSFCCFPKKEPEKKNAASKKLIQARTYQQNGYRHYYIFPNTFISSTEGVLFYLGNLIPESSTFTNLRIRNYAGTFVDEESKLTEMIEFMNQQSPSATQTILDEDRAILEEIQKNIPVIDRVPILGNDEIRIRDFYAFIAKNLYNGK